MNIRTVSFKTLNPQKENLSIKNFSRLTGEEAIAIRQEMAACKKKEYETIYIDAKDVIEADLSGINEIIHTHYNLQNTSTKMIFVYRTKSIVEKWVETTGLDKFVATAILPVK